MKILVVTGTGTGVGKTIAAAALAACAIGAGRRVAVVKPIQTGVAGGEPGDLSEVARLTGIVDLHECCRYPEPLAPATAARRIGERGPTVGELADQVRALADRDLVIIEGAGGAMVRFNSAAETLVDLIADLDREWGVQTILVASSGLGVLNIAALTRRAFAERGLHLRHLVVGDWPAEPDLADRCNLADLPDYAGAAIRGLIPAGAGRLDRVAFTSLAPSWLAPPLDGCLDVADFVARNGAPAPTRSAPFRTGAR